VSRRMPLSSLFGAGFGFERFLGDDRNQNLFDEVSITNGYFLALALFYNSLFENE
jgi:hypothetical protein